MKLVGLISGGKDSLFSLLHCVAAGHEIIAVANIEPEVRGEIDSYMYQSVGHEVISMVAGALALPIYRQKTKGKAVCQKKVYVKTENDEVEDLFQLLQKVKKDIPIEGVSVGAIKSDYQRTRVESVCTRLQLKSFAYLWQRNQSELLQEMIDAEFDAVIIKVASIGLSPSLHLGMKIRDIKSHLADINKKFGVHICGEGGEYETLTLDCPLFHRKITLLETEKVILSNDAFAEVGCLNIKNAELKSKIWGTDDPVKSLHVRLNYVHSVVKSPYDYIEDCVDDTTSELFPQYAKRLPHEDLPFPFQSESNSDNNTSSSKLTPYWKPSTSVLNVQEAHSSQKLNLNLSSLISSIDTTTSNLNFSTGWACVGNIAASSIQDAFFCLQKHLERMKYELADAVLVNIYLRDMEEYNNINKIYSQFMPEVSPPARVCVAIPLPQNINILIVVTAHKCVSKTQKALHEVYDHDREVLHVQSISHWAPANIGPYSQCVRIGSLLYIAGQIPLIPGTMEILNKPIYYQCKLTLRHILRIMQAVRENLNLSNVLQVLCYVKTEEVANDIPALWSYISENDTATIAVLIVKSLPRNAQFELETVAINATKPKVYEDHQVIQDYNVGIKQCLYMEPLTTSFICKVSYLRSKRRKDEMSMSLDKLTAVLKYCLHFIRREAENISSSLCVIKLFYDSNDLGLQEVIFELTKNLNFHHKVVITGIPVISVSTRNEFLTISGLCH